MIINVKTIFSGIRVSFNFEPTLQQREIVAFSPNYRYECQALFLTGKVAVTMRSPTYRLIGVKREITVSWIGMAKLK
jgi:hypothetical protein